MTHEIALRTLAPIHALVGRRRVRARDMGGALGELLPGAFALAGAQGAQPDGPPLCRYLEMGSDEFEIEAGVPIAAPVAGDAAYRCITLPGGRAAVTDHYGPFDSVGAAYADIQAWLEQHGHPTSGKPWETYWTDPTEEPDPAKWRTEVTWPIDG